MVEYSNKTDLVIESKKFDREGLTLKNCKNATIKNCDFSYNRTDKDMLVLSDCQDCQILDNKFHDKNTKGLAIKITGAKTKGHLIKGNEIFKLTYSKSNGGEPIRLGNSNTSGCFFNCTVDGNYFHDLAADPETVSSKSCGNIITNNRHENCKSSFVVRHGGFCTISYNKFVGEGGIRIYGFGNKIVGNRFKDNQSSKFPPITLGSGNASKDPNFTTYSKPSGKEGRSHAIYAQVRENIITDNVFENCKTKIYTRTDQPLKPRNNTVKNNVDGTFEEPTTPPPIPPVEPPVIPPVEPPVIPPVEPPVIPPVEPPVIPPVEPPTPPPPPTEEEPKPVDKHGILKVYADATDRPEHQYHDMDNIRSGRVDVYPDVYKQSTESVPNGFKATEIGGTSRIALYSTNGNPFGSTEHTVYFKFLTGPTTNEERLFQPYIGGGSHHNAADRCCEGFAYKVAIWGGGKINFRKEICHDAYCSDRNGQSFGPIQNLNNGGAVVGRWYGFKQIELHLPDRNRMEVWMDEDCDDNGQLKIEGNENRWRLIAANEDVKTGTSQGMPIGNWTASGFNNTCTGCVAESRSDKPLVNGMVRLEPYHVTHKGTNLHNFDIEKANCAVLRVDDKVVRIAYWSNRKISTTKA